MINRLRAFRTTKAMTQSDLGQAVGVSRQAIIAIEADQHDPSLDLAFKLAALFETEVETLFENPYRT
ncbi:helix-turn-helix transcriptional regulator [Candidatus Phycosocius spiralis]|nr:helix-turn-helix transcriptional regulator [Candidatus Phycosocius spiralis]